jgi:aarF domain-containing kinase
MLSRYVYKNIVRACNKNTLKNNIEQLCRVSVKKDVKLNIVRAKRRSFNTLGKNKTVVNIAPGSCKISNAIHSRTGNALFRISSMITCVVTCKAMLSQTTPTIVSASAAVATTTDIQDGGYNTKNSCNAIQNVDNTKIKYDKIRLKDVVRVVELLFIFSPAIFLSPIFIWREDTRELLNTILVWCIQKAGPTFIKLGQWASTRPDLFPPKTCAMLSVLHSNVNPEPFHHVKKQIEKNIGLPMNEVFEEFYLEPIGCGCVAQVYKGVLKLDDDVNKKGQLVAIKVLRHNICEAFERDLRLMRVFVSGLKHAFPWMKWLEISEAVDLFSMHMAKQLDLRVEANNLNRFRYNFGVNEDTISFPKPILSYEHVLIQSFEEGKPILSVLNNEIIHYESKNSGGSPDQLAENKAILANIGVKAFLKMVLIDNFVHGDLHPGNILVRHGDNPSNSKLIFLDAGLVVELTNRDRINFLRVFKAVAEKNGRLVGKLMLEQAKYENCPDHEKFISGMEKIVNVVDTFNLDKIEIGTVLRDVLNLVRENQVQVDSSFTTLVLSIILLEGLGRQLNPKLDIFKAALPMLIKLQLEQIF